MRRLWLFLLLSVLSSCSVTVPNIMLCTTAGVLSAGGDCSKTLSDEPATLDLDQWIAFLEPQSEQVLPGDVKVPARGGALCMSSDDFSKLKTAMEQACHKLGRWCSYEVQTTMEQSSKRIGLLQKRASKK